MRNLAPAALVLILLALFLLIGPALLLWSVGQMMQGQGLDFTFWNWLAAVVFLMLMRGSASTS